MNALAAYYDARYSRPDSTLYSRLDVAARALSHKGLVRLTPAPELDRSCLAGLHDADYLAAFEAGVEPLASSQGVPWSPAVRDATYAMLAGQIAAVQHALNHGIAMNLARGFHHAVRERGSGFCAINGLALVAHLRPDLRVFVIDCDEHGGNGTEEYAAELPNLFHASIFGTRFGCRGGTRSWAFKIEPGARAMHDYLDAIASVGTLLDAHRPDLVLYQAGADCHVDDPKSRVKLDDCQIRLRDHRVFEEIHGRGLPVVFSVGGGYQSALAVARLNMYTVQAARAVFGRSRSGTTSASGAGACGSLVGQAHAGARSDVHAVLEH